MIKLSIIENNSTIKNLLERFLKLQDDIELLSSHHSIESFLDSDEKIVCKAEILIFDIKPSRTSCLEGLSKILDKYPEIKVIIYSNQLEEDVIFEALTKGAFYYASKLDSMQHLLAQIRMIHNGRTRIQTLWAREILMIIQKESKNFTAKETQIVNAIAKGSSYVEVADHLNCSVVLIEKRSKEILTRLHGLYSRELIYN